MAGSDDDTVLVGTGVAEAETERRNAVALRPLVLLLGLADGDAAADANGGDCEGDGDREGEERFVGEERITDSMKRTAELKIRGRPRTVCDGECVSRWALPIYLTYPLGRWDADRRARRRIIVPVAVAMVEG